MITNSSTTTAHDEPRLAAGHRARKRSSIGTPLLLAATFISVVLAYLPFVRLSPDPHHDGLVLKNAIDVASGLTLYRQSFNQYGPLSVVTDAVAVALFGDRLLVLRILSVLFLAGAAVLLVYAWSSFMPRLLAAAAVALAFLLDPTLRGIPFIPWSSLQVIFWTAAVVACLVLLLRPLRERYRLGIAIAAGASVAAVVLLRVNTGGVVALGVVLALLTRQRVLGGVKRSEIMAWVGGALAPVIGFGIWLLANHAASQFWIQTVSLPARWYPSIASGGSSITAGTITILLTGFRHAAEGLLLAGLILLGLVGALVARTLRRRVVSALGAVMLTVLVFATHRWTLIHSLLSWGNPYSLAATPQVLLYVIPIVAFVAVIAVGVRTFFPGSRVAEWLRWPPGRARYEHLEHSAATRNVALISCALVGIPGIIQYYPVSDPRHLFWGVALAVGPAVGGLVLLLRRRWVGWVLVLCCFFSLIPSTVSDASANLSVPRRDAPSALRPLRGMQLTTTEWDTWGAVLDDLGNLTARHPRTPVLVYGPDALPATLAVDIPSPPDPYFVEWGPFRFDVPFGQANVALPWNLQARDRFVRTRRPIIWFARGNHQMGPFLQRYNYRALPSPQPACSAKGLPVWACPIIATPAGWGSMPLRG